MRHVGKPLTLDVFEKAIDCHVVNVVLINTVELGHEFSTRRDDRLLKHCDLLVFGKGDMRLAAAAAHRSGMGFVTCSFKSNDQPAAKVGRETATLTTCRMVVRVALSVTVYRAIAAFLDVKRLFREWTLYGHI